MTTILEDLRNAVKFQIRVLSYQKLLTAPQARELSKTAERGHTTTLQNLFQSLRKLKSKSTLAKIRSGTAEPKKTRKEMSDLVAWRLNRPLFGKTDFLSSGRQRGGVVNRIINIKPFSLIGKRFTKAIETKVKKYDSLLHVDVTETYKALYKSGNVKSATLDFLIMWVKQSESEDGFKNEIKTVRYATKFINYDPNINIENLIRDVKENVNNEESDYIGYAVGFQIIYKSKTDSVDLNKVVETDLKAFRSSNDIKYHSFTIKATHDNHICIYESFEIVNNITNMRNYTRLQRLEREGDEIYNSVNDGKLLQSLCLLNIKYDKEAYIVFYNDVSIIIHINNKGEYNYVSNISDDQRIYLYDKVKQHVAPSIYSKVKQLIKKEKTQDAKHVYNLMPAKALKKAINVDKIINNTIAFDFETFTDEYNNAVPYCCCVFGMIKNKQIKESFYGLDCTQQFIKFLDQHTQLLHHNKNTGGTAHDDGINYINVYGFNNSNFDNIFIYSELFKKDNNTEFIYSKGSFKKIEYNNLTFYDLRLIYNIGTLRTICKDLGFEKEKGIFPYSYITKDNINYIGSKPDFDFYEYEDITHDDYKLLNNVFNVKDETIKYCLLDTELTYLLAVDHINNNVGVINGKYYNTTKGITVGNIAKRLYNQCFQKDILFGSSGEALLAEKESYTGGRTSVFKKEFKSDGKSKLYYYDINASYVNEMTKKMPYKIIKTYKIEKTFNLNNIDVIEDTTLYYISSYNYIGNDENIINNLVEHDENGDSQSYKNYDKPSVHWGIELRTAVLNNYVVNVWKYTEYEERAVFKTFAEYTYEQRLINKHTNPSKSKFYKSVGNNLYGKFAQSQSNKVALLNDFDDIFDFIGDDLKKLVSYTNMSNGLGCVEYKSDKNADYSSLTRFSSYISACGRVALHRAMCDVGFENIYYCDTDSIFTTKPLSSDFLHLTQLGKFKLEQIIKSANFYSPKCYDYVSFDDEHIIKSKGIKSKFITDDDLSKLQNNETVNKSHTVFKKSLDGVKIIKQEFNITSTDKKILDN
jgi:hypothetical protein